METPPPETPTHSDHVTIRVKLFARARDLVGQEILHIDIAPGTTISELRKKLVEEYAELGVIAPHLLFALDNDYVSDSQSITSSAEVACFPPVSGG